MHLFRRRSELVEHRGQRPVAVPGNADKHTLSFFWLLCQFFDPLPHNDKIFFFTFAEFANAEMVT